MLAHTVDIKQHDELIVDRDTLCIQAASGNPFLSNQDYTFSKKGGKQPTKSDLCHFASEVEGITEVQDLIRRNVKLSENRARRIPNNPHIKNAIALNYLKMGDIEKAIEHFEAVLRIKKDYFPAVANLARCYSVKGDVSKALEIYREVEKRRPNDVRVLINTALQFFQGGNLEEALKYLKKIIVIKPDHPSALNNIGLIYLFQNKLPAAISALRKALRTRSEDHAFYNNLGVCFAVQRNYRKAIKCFIIAHSLNKTAKDVIHNLSQAYQELDSHEKVITLIGDYLKYYPQEVELRNTIAWSYFKVGLFKKSLSELKEVLMNTKPNDKLAMASLCNNIAVTYDHLGVRNKAEEFFIKSLEIHDKLISHLNLIHHLFKFRNFQDAKTQINRALCIYGDHASLLAYLGDYYYKMQDYSEARRIYGKALDIDPDILACVPLSTIEIDVYGNTKRALAVLEGVLKKDPNNVHVVNNYAYGLIMEDKLPEARHILDRIKEEDNVFLNCTRGLLLIREGSIQEGSRYYNRAKGLVADRDKDLAAMVNQKKYLELGRYYFEKEEPRDAIKLLRKGMSFKTTRPYYRKRIEELLGQIKASL